MSLLFYVSFAAPDGWRGAAFVEAESAVSAAKRTSDDGIAPKGDGVQDLTFRYDNMEDVPAIRPEDCNRLLTKDELLKIWPEAEDLMEYEDHV